MNPSDPQSNHPSLIPMDDTLRNALIRACDRLSQETTPEDLSISTVLARLLNEAIDESHELDEA